jgi:RimJ/RimL family protein N-acetyltransferase
MPRANLTALPNGTRRTILKAVDDQDLVLLRSAELAWDIGVRWRHHGTHPSPATYQQQFWDGVLAAFLVIRRRDRSPVGMVVLYNADFANARAFVGCFQFAGVNERGLTVEALISVVRYGFYAWPFRKLYFEVPEYNLDQFRRTAARHLRQEGALSDYWYLDGCWWDHVFFSVDRELSEELASSRFSRLLANPVGT